MTDESYAPTRTGDRLLRFIQGARRLTIVAPFVKRAPLRRLINAADDAVHVVVCTRWRADEIARGVSDLAVLDEVRQQTSGYVLLHPQLHAKAYIADGRAMIGSSNTSNEGLGWSRSPALELLVPVELDCPELVNLMETLEVASTVANDDLRAFVAQQAMKVAMRTPDTSHPDVSEAVPVADDRPPLQPHLWLPHYQVPSALWSAYRGDEGPVVGRLVAKDLAALGIRHGIESEELFRASVAVSLTQGFSGRIIEECSKFSNPIDAADRLRQLCEAAGLDVGRLGRRWSTLVKWVEEFLPNYAHLSSSIAEHWI